MAPQGEGQYLSSFLAGFSGGMPTFCAVLKQLGGMIQARVEMNVGKHVQLRISDDFAVGEVYPEKKRGPPGVSRGPYGGALPWACLSGTKLGLRMLGVHDGWIFFFFLSVKVEPYQEITVEGSVYVCVSASIIILSAQGRVPHTLEL